MCGTRYFGLDAKTVEEVTGANKIHPCPLVVRELVTEPKVEPVMRPVNTVPFELTPVAADLNGDGVAELIVVASERRSAAPPGIDPGVKKSWLAVFEFRDGAFVMGKLGPELTVPMQGLGFDRSRLLLVTPESHSFSFFRESTAASHLLALSLR